jgi:hypothetical protein
MANTVKLKRSAVASAVPTTAQLELGELAINTNDGKLFLKRNNGTESIVEVGATTGSVNDTLVADGSSITINLDTTDLAYQINTQAAGTLTINAPTGTLKNGDKLLLRIKSTNIQTFSWNAIFSGSSELPLPTTTTGGGKTDYIGFMYNSTDADWQLIATNFGF